MEAVTRPRRRIHRPIRSAAINATTVPATLEIRELCTSQLVSSVPPRRKRIPLARAIIIPTRQLFLRRLIILTFTHRECKRRSVGLFRPGIHEVLAITGNEC